MLIPPQGYRIGIFKKAVLRRVSAAWIFLPAQISYEFNIYIFHTALIYFNLGYKLNRISPEIAELLDHIPAKNAKLDALKAGVKQHKDEIFDNYTPDWLQGRKLKDVSSPEQNKDIDIDPDRD
jgi:hypothetical protein